MAWLILILGGITEILWAFGLKMTNGFTDLKWIIFTVFFMIVSFGLFAYAIKQLPIGTAYGVFTGIGAFGAAIIGLYYFHEEINWLKAVSLLTLMVGIIGLKMHDKKTDDN